MQHRYPVPSLENGILSPSDLEATSRVLRAVERLVGANRLDQAEGKIAFNPDLITLARHIKSSRKERNAYFASELMGEPFWDMLMALYIAEGEGYRLKVGDLCNESNVPHTTALRWIKQMIEMDLVARRLNPMDGRSAWIEIRPEAIRRMTSYLVEIGAKYFVVRG